MVNEVQGGIASSASVKATTCMTDKARDVTSSAKPNGARLRLRPVHADGLMNPF